MNKFKETEKELEEKDKKYHKLFENLNEGFIHAKIITNKKGEPIDWEYIDAVLLDIRMPVMNGVDALDEILKINPDAKMIMQTAYAMPKEREKCFNKGFVDFLSKPVVKRGVVQKLEKVGKIIVICLVLK